MASKYEQALAWEKRKRTLCCVDPDCERSGFALCDGSSVKAWSLPFPELLDRCAALFSECARRGEDFKVVVEAGWLNEGCWHLPPGCRAPMAAKIGNGVGRNHETGRKIVEMLSHMGIPCQQAKPLRKFWRGPKGKITQQEIDTQLQGRGWPPLGRSSQDARDAALLCLAYY